MLHQSKQRTRPSVFDAFEIVQVHRCLYDARFAAIQPQLEAKLEGSFQETGDSSEIISYRRNHFKALFCFSADPAGSEADHIAQHTFVAQDDSFHPVTKYIAKISASSHEGKQIALVQLKPSRDKSQQKAPRVEEVSLCSSSTDAQKWTCWERLQFSTATTNNGKRKDVRSFFRVKIQIFAQLSDHKVVTSDPPAIAQPAVSAEVLVASIETKPVVVRGRGPHFYNNQSLKALGQNSEQKWWDDDKGVKLEVNQDRPLVAAETATPRVAIPSAGTIDELPMKYQALGPTKAHPIADPMFVTPSNPELPSTVPFPMVSNNIVPGKQSADVETSGYTYHPLERRYLSAPIEAWMRPPKRYFSQAA